MMIPKRPPVRDKAYILWLRQQPCVITGLRTSANETVDPMHIGTAGKGIKSGDDEVLPVIHHYHALAHQGGELTMFRKWLPDDVLRAALRAYARERHAAYKDGLTGNKE